MSVGDEVLVSGKYDTTPAMVTNISSFAMEGDGQFYVTDVSFVASVKWIY